ncbi:hypothetical protein [Maribacter sp. R77961]|uniref:hypothetical protein n=1 Tax=Maribacter sp. R77961 TaxID=3093871 RepID=UPI0037C64CA8
MMNQSIEEFIGLNIDNIPYEVIRLDLEHKPNSKTYVANNQNIKYFTERIDLMLLTTDNNGVINSISADFNTIITQNFYDALLEGYGTPDSMSCSNKIMNVNEQFHKNGITTVETNITLRTCGFHENPTFIIWNKTKYQIVFSLNHELNKTDLRISTKFILSP